MANEIGNIEGRVFYCDKLELYHNWAPDWTTNTFNYYQQLVNFYLRMTEGWSTGIWENNKVYLLAGINNEQASGILHLFKFRNTYSGASDPTLINDLYTLRGYETPCVGTTSWIELDNPRRNRFTERYANLTYKTAQMFSDDLNQISELSNEPDCEIYIVGMPRGPLTPDPEFSPDELFRIVEMMCKAYGGSFNYLSIQADVVTHSRSYL